MNFTMRIKSWLTFKRLIKNLLQCVLSYDGINLNSGLREAVKFSKQQATSESDPRRTHNLPR